jgi:hypothetical protein
VNLLSLVPLLVFALAIDLHLVRAFPSGGWKRLLQLTCVPLMAMPVALTLAHSDFVGLLFQKQDPPSALERQVPEMDSSLFALASLAGMKPADPVFFASDGRYLLPRWPLGSDGSVHTSPTAWLPKPYEMISTLPMYRRDLYVERFTRRFPNGGWLVQKTSEINPGYKNLLSVIGGSFMPLRGWENEDWQLVYYVPRPR